VFQMHVLNVASVFFVFCMLQVLHLDVSKSRSGVMCGKREGARAVPARATFGRREPPCGCR
jgi:hypothetical protein